MSGLWKAGAIAKNARIIYELNGAGPAVPNAATRGIPSDYDASSSGLTFGQAAHASFPDVGTRVKSEGPGWINTTQRFVELESTDKLSFEFIKDTPSNSIGCGWVCNNDDVIFNALPNIYIFQNFTFYVECYVTVGGVTCGTAFSGLSLAAAAEHIGVTMDFSAAHGNTDRILFCQNGVRTAGANFTTTGNFDAVGATGRLSFFGHDTDIENQNWSLGKTGAPAHANAIAVYDGVSLTAADYFDQYNKAAGVSSNTAPSIGAVTIDTATIYADTTPIVAAVASVTDAEQTTGPFNLTWELKKGVAVIQTINETGLTAAQCVNRTVNFAAFGAITHGDSLTVKVTANDLQGSNNTAFAASGATVVANTIPVTTSVGITPNPPNTDQMVTATPTTIDADAGDTFTYLYQWQKDTGGNGIFADISGETAATLNLATAGYGSKGDQIRVKVTPNDGIDSGSQFTSATVTISDSAAQFTMQFSAAQNVGENIATADIDFEFTAEDRDGDAISFSLPVDDSAGAATLDLDAQAGNARSGRFRWTPPIDGATTPTRNFTLRATSAGGTADFPFVLTVVNTAPVLDAIGAQSVNRGATLEIPVSLTDANGQSVNFDVSYLVFEQPPGTPIAKPAWITLVLLTATTAKLVVTPPLAGNSEDIRIKVKFPDGVI